MFDTLAFIAILNVIIIVISLILGLILALSPRGDYQRTSFSLLAIGMGVWVTANFFGSNTSADIGTPLIYADYITGVLLSSLFWIFGYTTKVKVTNNPANDKQLKNIIAIAGTASIVMIGLILSGFIISLTYTSHLVVTEMSLYITYPLLIVSMVILGVKDLIQASKCSNKKDSEQVRVILTGLLIAVICIVIPNLILASFIQDRTLLAIFYNFSYIGILLFLLISSYAIFKRGLFDIRYVALRLFAYGLSLGIIISFFTFITFFLADLLIGDRGDKLTDQLFYTFSAIITALMFSPTKQFINQITSKIFFQQNYSVHSAFNEISTYATKSVDPLKIEEYSLKIFDKTIQPEYGAYLLFNPSNKLKVRAVSGTVPSKVLELEDFLAGLVKIKQKTTLSFDQTISKQILPYIELAHIGVITRLATNNQVIGYLILGDKKNGNNYNGHDIQLLELASNDLALALQNAQRYEEIKTFNATLQYKVSEATKALKRTNAKLIALDDTKDEFISMASHQLRTPLTSIKGYISMMLEGDLGDINDTQKKALQEAFDSSQRMVFLIADFLNVSRIRTGKFIIELKPTDLNSIIQQEIIQLQNTASLRGQKIIYKPHTTFPLVELDENKIRQVTMNMIDNAIFYTPTDGTITIELKRTKDEILFTVTDTGIGVPLGDQHRLFTKFFRADNAKRARPDGTGLGLFMAQKVIAAQHGEIIFKSMEGKGSTFGFRFPSSIISPKKH